MNLIGGFLAKRSGKIIAGALTTLLAGGITSIAMMQPAVEKAADYGAKAVKLYCKLPAVDRERFRTEVEERLIVQATADKSNVAAVRVTCPLD